MLESKSNLKIVTDMNFSVNFLDFNDSAVASNLSQEHLVFIPAIASVLISEPITTLLKSQLE